jgi:hypothetical protein
MSVSQAVIVQVAAVLTGTSATYVSLKMRSIAGTIQENERRSKRNKRVLFGDDDTPRAGLLERFHRFTRGGESDGSR